MAHCKKVSPIRQWTQPQAEDWSKDSYRERYLGISSFGITPDGLIGHPDLAETAIEQEIEDLVIETPHVQPPVVNIPRAPDPIANIVERAIRENKYLSFRFNDNQTIIHPTRSKGRQLIGFCYVKNMERSFPLSDLTELSIKEKYHSLRITGPARSRQNKKCCQHG
ncbi:MAG TPA: hypothetical protein VL727_24585, partial [Puia sp.]|nr:hypothetical protein [Puia sp.]